jgi:hypothetical protein
MKTARRFALGRAFFVMPVAALLFLTAVVSACMVMAGIAQADTPPATTITLEQPLHFLTPDGADVVAEAGEYEVRPLVGSQLQLRATGKESVFVQATAASHGESMETATALVVPDQQNPDLMHVLLLQPDGQFLDAVGSVSGVQTRATASSQPLTYPRVVCVKAPCPGNWPSGWITTPKGGTAVKGRVLIDVYASATRPVQNVQILVDGNPAYCSLEKSAPYECRWDTRKVKDGPHMLSAVIRDTANNVATTAQMAVIVQNQGATQTPQVGSQPLAEILVRYRGTATPATKSAIMGKMQLQAARPAEASDNFEVVSVPPGANLSRVLNELRQDPSVERAEPNRTWRLQGDPVDPMFPQQWGLKTIQAARAWQKISKFRNLLAGSPKNVVVAVLDGGIDYRHPDWSVCVDYINPGYLTRVTCTYKSYWIAPGCFRDNVLGPSPKAGCLGYDFVDEDDIPAPATTEDVHGTHVAGIIGAQHSDKYIAGVAPDVEIMNLRVANRVGEATTNNIVKALDTAIRINVDVIYMGFVQPEYDSYVEETLRRAGERNILVITPAGNTKPTGQNNDLTPMYPASYRLANIIAVAATDQIDRLASDSNFGSASVHLAAPGVQILSLAPLGGTYRGLATMSGTSQAAAHVAGAAALVKRYYPSLNAVALKEKILASVDPIPSLAGKVQTGGRLNLARAFGPFWTFEPVFKQSGLAGYDLASPADQAVALDFDGDGKEDLFMYRPGQGIAHVLRSNGNGTFTSIQATRGIAGFDLASPADRAVALDFNGDGKDDLFLYRPGAGSQAWLLQSNGNGTFTTVQSTKGIAGYDLANGADRAVALDFNGDGKDDLFLYRPGQGIAYVLQSNGNGSFTAMGKETGVAGYDLANPADIAVSIDVYGDKRKEILFLRPGQGIAMLARGTMVE